MSDFDRQKLEDKLLRDVEDPVTDVLKSRREGKTFSARVVVPLVMLMLVAFAVYAWYTDKVTITRLGQEDIPLIKADTSPVRVKPEDPGGMQFKHKDKLVYNTFSKKQESLPEVIELMPEPEQPVDRATLLPDEPEAQAVLEDMARQMEKEQPEPILQEPSVDAMLQERLKRKEEIAAAEEQKEVIGPALAPKPEKIEAKIRPLSKEMPLPKTKKTNGFYIQLGAFRARAEVDAQWQKIYKKHYKLLKDHGYIAERADLGKKGVFYRLKLGPIDSSSQARALCNKLKEQKQECFFVSK